MILNIFIVLANVVVVSPSPCIQNNIANVSCFGYNSSDSTIFLQAALNSGAQTVIVDNAHQVPWITLPLFINRSIHLILQQDIVAKENAYKGISDIVLTVQDTNNVIIEAIPKGGSFYGISMHQQDYDNTTIYNHSEHRHGLQVLGSQNVELRNIQITNTGGDGVYLNNVSIVTVANVTISHAYRNGISVISGSHILIQDLNIDHVNGTDPRSGIDIEPNKPYETLENITLRRCSVDTTGGCGIELKHAFALQNASVPVSIVVESCTIRNVDRAGLSLAPMRGGAQGTINVSDVNISNIGCAGLLVTDKAVESATFLLNSLQISNTSLHCTQANYGNAPVVFNITHPLGCGKETWPKNETFGNVIFGNNVEIYMTHNDNAVYRVGDGIAKVGTDPGEMLTADAWQKITGNLRVYSPIISQCVVDNHGALGENISVSVDCLSL
eukprot:m.159380 g.159380  ORF g.159380 m.159380 type:complete len:442 (-) comp15150_c0_seq3:118-1443(-)